MYIRENSTNKQILAGNKETLAALFHYIEFFVKTSLATIDKIEVMNRYLMVMTIY